MPLVIRWFKLGSMKPKISLPVSGLYRKPINKDMIYLMKHKYDKAMIEKSCHDQHSLISLIRFEYPFEIWIQITESNHENESS